MNHWVLFTGALTGALGVILGAFGAHGLKNKISSEMLDVWQTAVQYHFYHGLALCLVGLICIQFPQHSLLKITAVCFIGGIILFSGSLYGLALGGPRILGPITPIGGVFFIVAWVLLAVSAWKLS